MTRQTCIDIQELIAWQLEAEASGNPPAPEALAQLEAHTGACESCRAYRQTLHNLTASLAELDPVPVPDDLADRIMTRIQPAARPAARIPQAPSYRKYLPVAAAALLLALVVPFLLNGPGENSPGTQVATTQTEVPPVTGESPDRPADVEVAGGSEGPVEEGGAGAGAIQSSDPIEKQPSATPPGLQEAVTVAEAPPAVAPVQTGTAYTQVELAMTTVTSNFGYENEDDIYYDPVSELVGF